MENTMTVQELINVLQTRAADDIVVLGGHAAAWLEVYTKEQWQGDTVSWGDTVMEKEA